MKNLRIPFKSVSHLGALTMWLYLWDEPTALSNWTAFPCFSVESKQAKDSIFARKVITASRDAEIRLGECLWMTSFFLLLLIIHVFYNMHSNSIYLPNVPSNLVTSLPSPPKKSKPNLKEKETKQQNLVMEAAVWPVESQVYPLVHSFLFHC